MLNRGLPTSANFSVDHGSVKIRPVALRSKATLNSNLPFGCQRRILKVEPVQDDKDRTCQNLSRRRAFSVVMEAYWRWALANSCGLIEPDANRVSKTALTVSQRSSAALHGTRTPSSRRLCISGRTTSMLDWDNCASAATVSSYFRFLAKPSRVASLSSSLSFSNSTRLLAAVKSCGFDISR